MRVSLYCKKSSIIKVLKALKRFEDSQQNKDIQSSRRCVILACSLSVGIPIILIVITLPIVLSDIEKHGKQSYLNPTFSLYPSKSLFRITFTALQTINTLHVFVFPAMTMILFGFIYSSFVRICFRHIYNIRANLRQDLSKNTVLSSLKTLETAQTVHRQIEEAISFIIVFVYALTFGNVLNLVGVVSSDYMANIKVARNVYLIVVFLWTTICFVILTLCGSLVDPLWKVSRFLKDTALEVVATSPIDSRVVGAKELIYAQMFYAASNMELNFTAWGMFQIEKKLLLTTAGVMVTYGVLLSAEIK
ncbi:hypothetical protein JTE90_028642 [Oedothorax gibbosus]|uniref:Gustatory receptor n=1 Tax=Oedothorax gibbosus TaxID=931172 RepID=A0AAV6UZJ1_9ARAC|nr:hypothetical protein JTE90_028642 [Oedothorax gibbosus]